MRQVLYACLFCLSTCTTAKVATPGDAQGPTGGGVTPYANNCVGIDCACADAGPNKNYCGGRCVSLQNDLLNCGACGQACATYQSCVDGVCVCPQGELWCDGRCTQVANESQNCGACGKRCLASELCEAGSCKPNTTSCTPPCEDGQICQGGSCVCPTGQSFCDGRCVEILTNRENCGACGQTCSAEEGCNNGSCGCTSGQTQCTSGCVDLLSDAANCGSCGRACGSDQVCSDGTCLGAWTDGCTDALARELSVREIAVYQSVKISVASQGQAIATDSRRVSIVQGRAALFRVFVDLGSSFTAREFSARLAIWNDANVSRYTQKRQVQLASSDADPDSTFILNVPADKVGPTTKYSVELVECANGSGSGSVSQARFPASGEADLGARKTGTLEVTLIPVRTNSHVPDTSSATLAGYREYLEAMYPVEHVNLTVGKQISTDFPVNWTTLVEQIRAQRAADGPASNIYYYGLLKPTDALIDYCKKGCTAGIGYVTPVTQAATRAAVGLAFGDEVSAATMAHEIGHNHGRNHAPCSPGKISGIDPNYPDKAGRVDDWGYDARKQEFWAPSSTNDIMGYCDPKWTSAYTYQGLLNRVVAVNEIDGITVSEALPVALYRVLIVDADGPRWSVPFDEEAEAYGAPEQAEILDMSDEPVAQVTVYRTRLSQDGASTILVPPPEPGWHAVRVTDAQALPFSAPISVPGPQ